MGLELCGSAPKWAPARLVSTRQLCPRRSRAADRPEADDPSRLTTCPIAGAQLTAGRTVRHSAPLPAWGWLRRSRSTAQARELGELPRPHRQHGTTAITLSKREARIVTGKHFKLRGQALERRLELVKRFAR